MIICIKHKIEITINSDFPEFCTQCVVEAAIASAKNMGTPEFFICSECGLKFKNYNYYIHHVPCTMVPC